jgi:hypothetical protein
MEAKEFRALLGGEWLAYSNSLQSPVEGNA